MNQTDTTKIVTEIANRNAERMNALAEMNLRAWERMSSRQMDVMGSFMERSMRAMKVAAESKSYTDFVKTQTEMAKELGEHMMEESRNTLKVASEVRDEFRDWYKDGMSEMAADMHKVAPAAA
jgi:phasin family protein